MADRSVKVTLTADVKPFIAAMAKAEAAAKKLRDGLGDGLGDPFEPYEKEQQKRKRSAPKEGEQIAGAFARSFSRHLETAFKSLPKAKIDADSSEAQTKLQSIRQSLQDLSSKQVGVDINAAAALGELRSLQMELERLGDSAEIDIRADAAAALAQLRAVQREADKLADSRPTVQPDVDTSSAQADLADLRRRLDDLSSRRIGVDLDAGAARAELSALQRDLQRLNTSSPDIQVRMDSAAALAELRAVQSSLSTVNGRNARVKVDADVSGALTGIAMVGAALASLPAAATIGLGIGALGGAFAAAGVGAAGFAAVAIPSLGRINEALAETTSSAGGAGGAMKSAAQSAAEAASRALSLAQAQDRVKDSAAAVGKAQQGVKDALRDVKDAQDAYRSAQEAAAAASERISEVQAAGARRVADAERSLADAHRATQRAIEDLTRARERAQERIEDLALATEGGALSEERARLSIKRAQADLARVNADPKASSLDKEDTALRLKEAEFNLKRIREANGDLAVEQKKADQQGVEGSDEVTAAKERVIDAQRREAEAAQAVGDAQVQAARDVAAAQRDAADATRDAARAQRDIGDAQRKVSEAQQAVIKAQRDELRARQALKVEMLQQKAALEQAGAAAGGGGGAASKMSELSKAERALAKDIKAFTDEYLAWQRSLQPDIFPVIRKGMDLLSTGMKIGTPLIKASAGAFGELIEATNKGLQGEQWKSFFDDLTVAAPRAIEGLGNAAGNVAGGLAGIIQAFLPYTGDLMTWIEGISQKFETWGQNLGESQGFKSFVAYAQANAPKVGEILGNLATAVGKIFEAAAEPGQGALDFLVTLSEKLAGMSPEQVEAVAKGVAAVFAAAKLGASLKIGAIVLLAEVLGKMSPGQIEAVALAIAGVVVAVKGYQAVSGALGFWQSLSGGIDKAGKSADGAQGKLGGLIGTLKAGGIAALLAGAAIGADKLNDGLWGLNPNIDKLAKGMSDLVEGGTPAPELLDQIGAKTAILGGTQFETFADSAARLASDNPFETIGNSITGFVDSFDLVTIDNGKQSISNLDQALTTMVSTGRGDQAAQMFDMLTKTAANAGVPLDKLKELFPEYTSAVSAAAEPTNDAATAIDVAKVKMDGFQDSLNTFAGRTDAYQALRNMETAYKDAALAIEASNGKLEINAGMTGKQRDAVILAREKFAGYIESVKVAADGAATLSGRTSDGTKAVLDQLPELVKLAGKSSEAKSQILLLAQAYGISAEDAIKAMKGGKGLRDVLAELKSKEIIITVKTEFQDELSRQALRQASARADGGIYSTAGRQYMASGGIRSLGSNPQAMIAKSPYMISGRAGPDVVFGEAGWEAYIPLDSSKRDRGLQVLGEAASAMGMAVVPTNVNTGSGASGASMGGSFTGGGFGGTVVTVTGIDSLKSSLDTTALGITGSLGGAVSTLDATLGDTGSLTTSVDAVGSVAGDLAGEIATLSATMKDGLSALTSSVDALGAAMSAAREGGGSSGSTASQGTGSKSTSAPKGIASGGYSMDRLTGIDAMMAAKLKAEAEKKIMINTVAGSTGGSAGVAMQGGTNWSRTSRPVQSSGSWSSGGSSTSGTAGTPSASGSASTRTAPLVQVQSMQVREQADIDMVAERLHFKATSRG